MESTMVSLFRYVLNGAQVLFLAVLLVPVAVIVLHGGDACRFWIARQLAERVVRVAVLVALAGWVAVAIGLTELRLAALLWTPLATVVLGVLVAAVAGRKPRRLAASQAARAAQDFNRRARDRENGAPPRDTPRIIRRPDNRNRKP